MGFMDFVNNVKDNLKKQQEEQMKAYEKGMRMSEEQLVREYKSSWTTQAKKMGYAKALKARGINPNKY